MSELSERYQGRRSFADFGGRRPAAFVDASRHSARVQFLRRAIVICCVCAVGLIGFVLVFDPMHRLELGFSVARVGLEGTRITMEKPRLSGYRENGRPYEIKAKSVVQDTTKPKLFELEQVDARLGGNDGSTTRIEALKGLYNSDNDQLELSGIVRVRNEGRYDMTLKSAVVNMRANVVNSSDPVTVLIPGGRVDAGSASYTEAEHKIEFSGSVHSVFEGAAGAGEPSEPSSSEAAK